jgi:hypothetical protein
MKNKKYEKWATAFVQNLASHLNLSGWRIEVIFCDKTKSSNEECAADINVDSSYMFATLRLYPYTKKAYDDWDVNMLKEIFSHEFVHILIDPLYDHALPFLSDVTRPLFTDTLENVTQRFTRIIMRSLPKNIIPPR